MQDKKYYTISELTKILNTSASKLRYLEKTVPQLTVANIKGRRYYTKANIAIIKNKLLVIYNSKKSLELPTTVINNNIVKQIDHLIANFNNLSTRLKTILDLAC